MFDVADALPATETVLRAAVHLVSALSLGAHSVLCPPCPVDIVGLAITLAGGRPALRPLCQASALASRPLSRCRASISVAQCLDSICATAQRLRPRNSSAQLAQLQARSPLLSDIKSDRVRAAIACVRTRCLTSGSLCASRPHSPIAPPCLASWQPLLLRESRRSVFARLHLSDARNVPIAVGRPRRSHATCSMTSSRTSIAII